jgi:hypothetical protein
MPYEGNALLAEASDGDAENDESERGIELQLDSGTSYQYCQRLAYQPQAEPWLGPNGTVASCKATRGACSGIGGCHSIINGLSLLI